MNRYRGFGKSIARWGVAGIMAALIGGCDLQNPTLITYDDADPEFLINGAYRDWGEGYGTLVVAEFVASDEGRSVGLGADYNDLNLTGDLGAREWYQQRLALLSGSRELTRLAIERARDRRDEHNLRRGLSRRGWYLVEVARRWGDQPVRPGEKVMTEAEQYEYALEHFTEAVELSTGAQPTDSLRLTALSGIARTQWELGKIDADANRLTAAISAAEEVIRLNPAFTVRQTEHAFLSPDYLAVGYVAIEPEFADIPPPPVQKFVDTAELWVIIADSYLRKGDLDLARATLRSSPILAKNHLGLAGRDPQGEPLTEAELDAFLGSLDAEDLRFVVDELFRESTFAQGRRNVGPQGPLFPVPLPPTAF